MTVIFRENQFQYFHESSLTKWQTNIVPENVYPGQEIGVGARFSVIEESSVYIWCIIYDNANNKIYENKSPITSYASGASGNKTFVTKNTDEGDYWAYLVAVQNGKAVATSWVKIAGVSDSPVLSGYYDYFEYLYQDRRYNINEWADEPPEIEGGVAVGIRARFFNDGNVKTTYKRNVTITGPGMAVLAEKESGDVVVDAGKVASSVIECSTKDVMDTYKIGGYYARCILYAKTDSGYEIVDSQDKLIATVTSLPAEPPGPEPPGPGGCLIDKDCPEGYKCKDGKCVEKTWLDDVPWTYIGIGGAALAAILLLTPSKGNQPIQIIMPQYPQEQDNQRYAQDSTGRYVTTRLQLPKGRG